MLGIASLASVAGLLVFGLVTIILQVFVTFLMGLMFYYFIAKPEKGKETVDSLMRSSARIYTQSWMFGMVFLMATGFSMLVKAFFGVFQGFAYVGSNKSVVTASGDDLKIGLTLLILGGVVYAIHWGFQLVIDRAAERKGTVVTKFFNISGLMVSSLVFFGGMFAFVIAAIQSEVPGASLAWVIGILPFWAMYLVRTMWMIRAE